MTANQCYQAGLNHQRGFSLFEMVIVILLIGILMSLAIDRLIMLQVEAERVSVQHVMGSLDSAVYVETAEIVLKEGLAAMRKLEHTNPMDYLAKLPHNYVGVKSSEAARDVPVSSWYFDSDNDVLVYTVKNKQYFETDIEGEPRIQLKLSLVYRDNNRNSNIQGVRLEKSNEYSWKAQQ